MSRNRRECEVIVLYRPLLLWLIVTLNANCLLHGQKLQESSERSLSWLNRLYNKQAFVTRRSSWAGF